MDMELLNAISEMMAKNNDILRQEMKTMIEEKVTKEIHLIAEGHAALLEKLDNRASVSELKEVKSDLATVYDSTIKHRKRIEKLESEVKILKKAN